MTDWIEHTTGRCPVDPDTVVEVLLPGHTQPSPPRLATLVNWRKGAVAYYRIITPAPTPLLFLGGDPVKPPELEMTPKAIPEGVVRAMGSLACDMNDGRPARYRVTAVGPNGAVPPTDDAPEVTFKSDLFKDPEPEMAEPDLITLRLECLKLAVSHFGILDREQAADRLLHYVLNGSVDRA